MPENYITCQDDKGSINISEEVIVSMVRAAVGEVEGVAGLGAQQGDLAGKLGIKSAAKGIRVQFNEGVVSVELTISVRYGANVVNVAKAVQESVTSAVESMTGMGTPRVDVHVAGIVFDR